MKKMYFALAVIISLFMNLTTAIAGLDNNALVLKLRDCSMDVVKKNIPLIETNKDGSRTSKGITPTGFGTETYKQFGRMIKGEGWNVNSLKGSYDKKQLAHALAIYLAASRIVIAKLQKKINTDKDGTTNPKGFYPAIFGRLTADEFFKRTGIKIKQTTTGKGMGARNPKYNKPDAWEKKALAKIEAADWDIKKGFGEKTKTAYRYIHPLEIKKACLSCHGDPRGAKDVSGHTKEGYKLHETRGGISVMIPLAATH